MIYAVFVDEMAVWNRGGSVPGRHQVERIVVGPFPVQGEQIQRGVGAYAFHQIHSRQRAEAQERSLQCCTVCARTCWLEDMSRLRLFVEAKVGAVEEEEAADRGAGEGKRRMEDLLGGGCTGAAHPREHTGRSAVPDDVAPDPATGALCELREASKWEIC